MAGKGDKKIDVALQLNDVDTGLTTKRFDWRHLIGFFLGGGLDQQFGQKRLRLQERPILFP